MICQKAQFISNFCYIKSKLRIMIFLLVFLISITKMDATSGVTNIVTVESITSCPNNSKLPCRMKNMTAFNSHGKTIVSLIAEIRESLKAPLAIQVSGERCDFQRIKCTATPGVNFPDLCILSDSIYAQVFFTKLQPPILKCPVEKVMIHVDFIFFLNVSFKTEYVCDG